MENEIAGALMQADFGLVALFMRASLVVKLVIIVLAIASVWAWSIILSKTILFRSVRAGLVKFSERFWSGEPLDEIYASLDGASLSDSERLFQTGMKEWRKSHDQNGAVLDGSNERIERAMLVSLTASRTHWGDSLNWLATIGSISPFIGLFGTVWGIKIAFQDIAIEGSTNLAVVAPGIAEALVATALGLLAAIPAVVFYNKFNSDTERFATEHASFAEEFALLISRQMSAEKKK